jgi:hypothetical protein
LGATVGEEPSEQPRRVAVVRVRRRRSRIFGIIGDHRAPGAR